jgi:acid phosphatase
VIDIPKAPYAWPQALGELTPEGMFQEYQLGKLKAEQYKVRNHLLPDSYDRNSMMVRSTDFDRTLMSAESFLLGLYPPTIVTPGQFTLPYDYHPIPIHTVSLEQEDLLITKLKRFEALISKYVYSQKAYQEKKLQIKNQLPQWQALSGLDLSKTDNIIYLADNLHVRKLHHIAMPAGMTPAMADEIMSAGEYFSLSKYASYPVAISASKEF